jgi:hypothetical protein
VWARAPYLHNGSVPTLEALLEPTAGRPTGFYRGYDVYDRKGVGFVCDKDNAGAAGFHFVTTDKGNGNAGHEGDKYGTKLSPEKKKELLEYLKTL